MRARKSLGPAAAASLLGISAPLLFYRARTGKIRTYRRKPLRFSPSVVLAARESGFDRKDPRGRRSTVASDLTGVLV